MISPDGSGPLRSVPVSVSAETPAETEGRESPPMPGQAVILAGGLGTRMRPFTDTSPKPMVEVGGRPFLDRLLIQLKDAGFTRVLLLLGYLPDVIMDHVQGGERFGLRVDCSVTPVEDDTGRRLRRALPLLEDRFLLLYCDNYCPLDFAAMWRQYLRTGVLAQITAYANEDGYTRDNLSVGEDGIVRVYDKKRQAAGLRGVDIGYAFMDREVVSGLPDRNVNFEAAAYPALVAQGRLGAYMTGHRYFSIGSPDRLPATERFFTGPPAVILDRDGVLNAKAARARYVTSPEEFHWLPGAVEAVKMLNRAGRPVFVVTNQAGIARGMMTEEDLRRVHDAMRADLARAGAHVDGIYHCPHGWDEGCGCRKPAPGMLFAAQRDHCLDLSRAVFIGDDERDMEAGRRAGCPTVQVTEDRPLISIVRELLEHGPDGDRRDAGERNFQQG